MKKRKQEQNGGNYLPLHVKNQYSMTLAQLRTEYPAYRIVGRGLFAVVCGSAGRITLVESIDVARELKHMNCGHGCNRYESPHVGYRLAAPQETKTAPVRIGHGLGWD